MKVVFICGSVEPGKNGVGDYTRRMCSALIHEGVEAEILSLNDKNVKAVTSETQAIDGKSIAVKRIPISAGFKERIDWTVKHLKKVQPNWISLQYVPNSFDLRGMPLWLPLFLKKIKGLSKSHIMFHELAYPGTTLKNKLYRFLQIQLLKSIVSNFKPKVIHTHTPFYLKSLSDWNIEASPLPVFSNIDKVNFKETYKAENSFRIGLFSKIKYTKKIMQTLEQISQNLKETNKIMQIVLLGGTYSIIQNFQKKVAENKKIDAQVIIKGFLPEEKISKELQKLDVGITPVPIHALGKSGSVAAFLEHGIPVIAPEKANRKGLNCDGFLSDFEKEYLLTNNQICNLSYRKELPKINNLVRATKIFKNTLYS